MEAVFLLFSSVLFDCFFMCVCVGVLASQIHVNETCECKFSTGNVVYYFRAYIFTHYFLFF